MSTCTRVFAAVMPVALLVGLQAPVASSDDGVPTRVTWVDCPSYLPEGVECGRLDVPIDWAVPNDSRRASISFAVHRATAERKGTYTFNPGGPGGSGVGALDTWLTGGPFGRSGALPPAILRHYDVVAWDPRGVGGSTPTLQDCDGTATYGELPQAGMVDWGAVATAYADSMSIALADCLAANPDLAPYLGTHYVIRDLDACAPDLASRAGPTTA